MGKGGQKLARNSIPELGVVYTVLSERDAVMVRACCQDLSAVGTERRVKGPTQTVKGGDELARGWVPEVSAVIRACRQDPSAVRTKRRVLNGILMVKRGNGFARSCIPKLGGLVLACCQDSNTVRTEGRL